MRRAICFRGVPPEAKLREPEKQYTLWDVIHALAEQGWDLVPNRRVKPFSATFNGPKCGDPIVAEYRRWCGATRRVTIQWPPQPCLHAPCSQPSAKSFATAAFNPPDTVTTTILRFNLREVKREADQFGHGPLLAIYEEEA